MTKLTRIADTKSDKLLNPLIAELQGFKILITEQKKDSRKLGKILGPNQLANFIEKQELKRDSSLAKLRKNTQEELDKITSDRKNYASKAGQLRLKEMALFQKRLNYADSQLKLQKEAQQKEDDYRKKREDLLKFNTVEAKQKRRLEVKRNMKDKVSDSIFGKLVKPLGFLEKMGGFSFLDNRQKKRSNKREILDLDKGYGAERATTGMKIMKNITPGKTKSMSTGKPPKSSLSPKRSAIVKHFPQFVYLADAIDKNAEENLGSAKKGRKGKGLFGSLAMMGPMLAKFAGAAAGIAGIVLTVKDVIGGVKTYGAEGGGTGKASTSNIVAAGITGGPEASMGSQVLKYGLLGAGIGTFFGPMGTLAGAGIGAGIGAIVSAVGQDRIAKIIQFVAGKNLNDAKVEFSVAKKRYEKTFSLDKKSLKQYAADQGLTVDEVKARDKKKMDDKQKQLWTDLTQGTSQGVFAHKGYDLLIAQREFRTELATKSDADFKAQYGKSKKEATKAFDALNARRDNLISSNLDTIIEYKLGMSREGPDGWYATDWKLIQTRKLLSEAKTESERIRLEGVIKDTQRTQNLLDAVRKGSEFDKDDNDPGERDARVRGEYAKLVLAKRKAARSAYVGDSYKGQASYTNQAVTAKRADLISSGISTQGLDNPSSIINKDNGFNVQKPVEDAIIRGREVIPMSIKDNVILSQADNIVDMDTGENYGGTLTGSKSSDGSLNELKAIKNAIIDLYALEKFKLKTNRDSLANAFKNIDFGGAGGQVLAPAPQPD